MGKGSESNVVVLAHAAKRLVRTKAGPAPARRLAARLAVRLPDHMLPLLEQHLSPDDAEIERFTGAR